VEFADVLWLFPDEMLDDMLFQVKRFLEDATDDESVDRATITASEAIRDVLEKEMNANRWTLDGPEDKELKARRPRPRPQPRFRSPRKPKS
jgi:hypothetical protein